MKAKTMTGLEGRKQKTRARKVSDEKLANIAKALGHPARLTVIRLLNQKQGCIGCDIVDKVGLAQSTTSEHLRILKAAGIIAGEVEGPRVCYSLNPEMLEPLREFLTLLTAPGTAEKS